jgi:HAD superfamily hydrolase (TIGR01509 family)
MEEKGPPEKNGVRPLFDYLASRNIPIALATSTSERSARWMIEKAGLTPYFSAWAFGSEVTHGKPAPDIFLLAKTRLGVADPARCVVFEDSPAGLSAALAAGMKPVFVRDMVDPEPNLLDRVWKTASRLDEAASDAFFTGL